MKKKASNQKITCETLLHEAKELHAYLLDNNRHNGKHRKMVEFLEEVLADDDEGECQSEEDRQFRQTTATCLLSLIDRSDTKTGERSGGSRSVVGAMSSPLAPQQLTGGCPSNVYPPPSPPPNGVTPIIPRPGGYDGGLTIGWEGTWSGGWSGIAAALKGAKEQAQSARSGEHVKSNLGGFDVIVDPCGGKVGGNTWHYKFHVFGVTFLIHQNPNNTQQVRATYGAEALAINPLPALHRHVREFLAALGLTVTKETLTRVDMQVMVDARLEDFLIPILELKAIMKMRKDAIYRRSGKCETYRAGDIDKVQVCIYDKRAEMRRMDLGKQVITIEHCIGAEWWNSNRPITRVEFRVGREALKCFRVNSVEDLLKRERGLINILTKDWFRLLNGAKIRGKENKMQMLPLWERVRSLFFEHFTGDEIRDVEYRKREPVSCDPVALEQQAEGCVASAFTFRYGEPASFADVDEHIYRWVTAARYAIYQKMKQHAERMKITKGITLGLDNEQKEQFRTPEHFENYILRLRR